jgi:hypothetical protein
MPPWKAVLLSLAVALAGCWALVGAGARLEAGRREMAELRAAGRAEGESFLKTLEGRHAERQLQHFDRQRALAVDLARARRDQLLGLLGLVAAVLVLAAGAVIHRIGAEIREERERLPGGDGAP